MKRVITVELTVETDSKRKSDVDTLVKKWL